MFGRAEESVEDAPTHQKLPLELAADSLRKGGLVAGAGGAAKAVTGTVASEINNSSRDTPTMLRLKGIPKKMPTPSVQLSFVCKS